jgi:hypothetical protein
MLLEKAKGAPLTKGAPRLNPQHNLEASGAIRL